MSEPGAPSKAPKIVHWVALVFLFLMMAQPTFDNVRGLLNGALVMGDIRIEVTFADMALHLLATVVGWLGWWWFFKRQKRGAYVSIAAHLLGLVATLTQTPELMDAIPLAALGVFYVILLAATLGPITMFKGEYS